MTSAGPLEAIVFIDAQNVYLTAREAFGWEDESSRRGNFNPLALGQLLTKGPGVELKQVRVYTGAPSQQRDDQGYRAARKRFDTWKYEGGGKVIVRERNLQYRPGEKPREKGVDVLLAIELVRFAGAGVFDLGIVLSADNDIVPALELVCDVLGSTAVQSVSLQAERGYQSAPALGSVSPISGSRSPAACLTGRSTNRSRIYRATTRMLRTVSRPPSRGRHPARVGDGSRRASSVAVAAMAATVVRSRSLAVRSTPSEWRSGAG
jgi:uncharacterized LabA/DUF88 family protein